MKHPWLVLKTVVITLGLVAVTGCSRDDQPNSAATAIEPVVVYSARAEHLIRPLFERFTEETGVPVQFQTGNANAMVERLKAEGRQTPADLLITVDAGNLWYAADQDLFQPLNSALINETIPAHLRDPNDLWTGLSIRARTFVYHKDRVDPAELTDYANLADPKWQGRLCLRSSSSVYTKSLLASLIAHHGEQRTEEIAQGWVNNLAARPHSRDANVMDAILAGQCDVGLVNTYYFGRLEAENLDTPLTLAWANQNSTGTHVNVSGAGITKHAKNPDGARQLIEWLASDQAQQIFGALNREYPAKPNTEIDPQVAAWGQFIQDQLNLAVLGEQQQAATKLADRISYD
ncbi:iron deficiency-induced protein A [Thiomicrospira aerophila AL3]|uniref:Iron deficiency-induced protein A n=1 Tax=Thiomicrospira aerophila AL3 TaxID=717772 RepID=W0DU87_9GAMM|nr:Fe(3+) ABC transporter substrate-binding protein [Thiomicrospira aerophila]AHF02145.1 iron deficiency-induced protein A [Thiomicrospira aerophila AL3]